MTKALTVLSTEIRLHDGLYSLNDLHKASGGEEKHRPAFFLRTDQTKALIDEIENCADMHSKSVVTREGRNGGTYACKELVYAYAMWISPKFHLHVIRAFDGLVSQPSEPERITIEVTKDEYIALLEQRAGVSLRPRRSTRRTWTPEEDRRLLEVYTSGGNLSALARQMGRSRDSLRHRLARLNAQPNLPLAGGAA